MIGLDTNVVVRYIMQDDPSQARLASELMETELSRETPGYVTLVVLAEVVWVLKTVYGVDKEGLSITIAALLETEQLKVERSNAVLRALKAYQRGTADFSDALIASVARDDGCSRILTFDKKAVSVGMDRIAGR